MDITSIFKIIKYSWLFLQFLQIIVALLSIKSSKLSPIKIMKKSYEESSESFVTCSQSLTFILLYNAIIVILWLVTGINKILYFGTSIGVLLSCLSMAGDLIDMLFPNSSSDESALDSISIKNLVVISIICGLLNSGTPELFLKDIKTCSELYSLSEISLLVFFVYKSFYYFEVSIYIILGLIDWNPRGHLDIKIYELKQRLNNLKSNYMVYSKRLDYRAESTSTRKDKFLLSINAFFFIIFTVINYLKQIVKNILLLWLTLSKKWAIRRADSLHKAPFLIFIKKASHFSIIVSLCATYIYVNFVTGPESIITKIIFGFSSIIIIPIAVNRITEGHL